MAEVTELVTRFSFKGSTAPLANYNKGLGRGIGLLAGMTAAFGVATVAVGRFAHNTLQAVDLMAQLARNTQESITWIQEMGYAASVSGSSAQAFQSSVEGLSQKIGEAAQKGSEEFSRLGISVRDAAGNVKSAERIMDELNVQFQRMNLSTQEQRSFAEALGIDPSLLQLLGKTRGEIDGLRERARDLGVLNQEQADAAAAYNDSITTLRFGMNALRQMIAVGMAPQLQALAEWFTDVLAANKDWIMEGVERSLALLGSFFKAIGRLLPLFGAIAAGFAIWKAGAIAATIASAPVLAIPYAIAAAIAVVLLVIDDLIVAFQGGQSVIRDFFLEWLGWDIKPFMENTVALVQLYFNKLTEYFTNWLEFFGGMFSAIGNILTGNFDAAWEDIKDSAVLLVEAIRAPFIDFFNWIAGKFEWVQDLASSVGGWLGFGDDDADAVTVGAGGNNFLPGGTAALPTGGNRVEQNVNIEVRTNDPDRAARGVSDNLQQQLDEAQSQATRGGR